MNTLQALLAFSAWYIFLSFVLVVFRLYSGARNPNLKVFDQDGKDVPGFGFRLTRARNNCYENLPLFAAVVLVAAHTNSLAMTDQLAMYVFLARVAQSVVHLISISRPMILLRAILLATQYTIIGLWILQLARV